MQNDDPLARGYNFDQIAVDTVREQNRREVVASLSEQIQRSQTTQLAPNQHINSAVVAVESIEASVVIGQNGIQLSEPYDSFSHNESLEIESRIIVIGGSQLSLDQRRRISILELMTGVSSEDIISASSALGGGINDKMFLVVAMGKDQKTVSKSSLQYGAIQKEDGRTEYFKFVPASEVEEYEQRQSMRSFLSMGMRIPNPEDEIRAIKLDPVEELSLTAELSRATEVLKKKADELLATSCIDDRSGLGQLWIPARTADEQTIIPTAHSKQTPGSSMGFKGILGIYGPKPGTFLDPGPPSED